MPNLVNFTLEFGRAEWFRSFQHCVARRANEPLSSMVAILGGPYLSSEPWSLHLRLIIPVQHPEFRIEVVQPVAFHAVLEVSIVDARDPRSDDFGNCFPIGDGAVFIISIRRYRYFRIRPKHISEMFGPAGADDQQASVVLVIYHGQKSIIQTKPSHSWPLSFRFNKIASINAAICEEVPFQSDQSECSRQAKGAGDRTTRQKLIARQA
jgi:hypothetical protein